MPDCATITFCAAAAPTAVNASDAGESLTSPGEVVGFGEGVPVGAVGGGLVGFGEGGPVGLGVGIGFCVGVGIAFGGVGVGVGVPLGADVGAANDGLAGFVAGVPAVFGLAAADGATVGVTAATPTNGLAEDDEPPPPQAAKQMAPEPMYTNAKRTVRPLRVERASAVSESRTIRKIYDVLRGMPVT